MPTSTTTVVETEQLTLVEFTRVYKMDGKNTIKTQPLSISVDVIASVRPSNRLGKDVHRSTIELANGTQYDLAEKYSEVLDIIAEAA